MFFSFLFFFLFCCSAYLVPLQMCDVSLKAVSCSPFLKGHHSTCCLFLPFFKYVQNTVCHFLYWKALQSGQRYLSLTLTIWAAVNSHHSRKAFRFNQNVSDLNHQPFQSLTFSLIGHINEAYVVEKHFAWILISYTLFNIRHDLNNTKRKMFFFFPKAKNLKSFSKGCWPEHILHNGRLEWFRTKIHISLYAHLLECI